MRSSDHAEAFNANCDHEIHESHHGNNPSTKCEGSDVCFHNNNNTAHDHNTADEPDDNTQHDFHSFFQMVQNNMLPLALRTCTNNLNICGKLED